MKKHERRRAMLTGPGKRTESVHPGRLVSMPCPNVGGYVTGCSACFRGPRLAFATDDA